MKIKNGDRVRIVDCAEAQLYGHIVFDVISDSWKLGHGTEVVRITSKEKDIRGGFSIKCLKKVE